MVQTHFNYLQWQQVNLIIGGKHCLRNISFTIKHQGITAIMGGNGAGKTLLLQLCAGLLTASNGTILWHYGDDKKLNEQPLPPQLTMVPQKTVLLNINVKQNILAPLRYHHTKHASERAQMALQWADIEHLQHNSAHHLSTGEQQLVALARAWALQPTILLLDEPCANLDPIRKRQIDTLILQLSHNCKVILSTHSTQQARRLATDIILLEHGKLSTHLDNTSFFDSTEFKQFLGAN